MSLLLGIDGGNTKTVALLAEQDGTVVGKARSGCADVHAAPGSQAALGEILTAVRTAIDDAGATVGDIKAAVLSLAGADWPEDFELLEEGVGGALPHSEISVVNDSLGMLRCGSPDNVGVAVAVGTGAAIGARNAEGQVFHLGFWPDPMGGDALAREALRAVWRADLGLGDATSLTASVCAAFDVASPADLLFALNRRDSPPPRPSTSVSSITLDEADAEDVVARAIVVRQGERLGRAARITADRVRLEHDRPLVLGGGVLSHRSTVLEQAIGAEGAFEQIVRPAHQPALGALSLAFDAVALEVPLARLAETAPPAAYFATA